MVSGDMSNQRLKSVKPKRIALYGMFGAGNLGNECTLQVIVEQILRHWPDAKFVCFCANPQDVRTRHGITAFPSEAIDRAADAKSGPRGRLERALRIFLRIPVELIHWVKILYMISRADRLVVAGTGIIRDDLTGPLGWPYDIFKLATLAALCRVKIVLLSVGVGPIRYPLSRWFLRRSFALAYHRSYRDQASKDYMENIGFDTDRDLVCPDVVFGLSPSNPASAIPPGQRQIVGLGLKDYGSEEPRAFREYLDTMAVFVSWLQGHGYCVRLLIGDMRYDVPVIKEFVELLKSRNIPAGAPLLITEPVVTVKELLRQVGDTEFVISSRYHNLVMALIQNKPVIALSDHAKLDSLATDFGLAKYLVPLDNLKPDILIDKFERLEKDLERLTPHIEAELVNYRQALDALYARLFAEKEPVVKAYTK